jgi:hypothetical protein
MRKPTIAFVHSGLTVHAAPCGEAWCGEILDEQSEVLDVFAYTREEFPGAVIGALAFPEVSFSTTLAARLWLHTGDELAGPSRLAAVPAPASASQRLAG